MSRDTKQMIIVRKDLAMRKGKIAAQAAHASMAFLTRKLGINDVPDVTLQHSVGGHLRLVEVDWLENSFAKVCVYVNSEEELLTLVQKAKDDGLEAHVVTDSGRTEFHGQPTITCAAIGPDYVEVIDRITGDAGPLGRLPLL